VNIKITNNKQFKKIFKIAAQNKSNFKAKLTGELETRKSECRTNGFTK
jgi:hypothetical protein